jgi:hypothetical protein
VGEVTLNGKCIATSLLDGCNCLLGSIFRRIAVVMNYDLRPIPGKGGTDQTTQILCPPATSATLPANFCSDIDPPEKEHSQR